MQKFSVFADNSRELYFFGNKVHNGKDFFLSSNSTEQEVEFLIFLDSRGISKGFDKSLVKEILNFIQEKSYVIVCRPLMLTTWATLYNFLLLNKISPKLIITNVGFVDFTPKKKSILQDSMEQIEFAMGRDIAKCEYIEDYLLNSGNIAPIFMMKYQKEFKAKIEKRLSLNNGKTIVINTPPCNANIKRERPRSFYQGVKEANKFNRLLEKVKVIDFDDFDSKHTYDGVHYTIFGNKIIMNKLRRYL